MTAQHFAEVIDTVQMTTGATYIKIAEALKVGPETLRRWRRSGVPSTKVRTTRHRLRVFFSESLG